MQSRLFNKPKYTIWIVVILLLSITTALAVYFIKNNYEYEKHIFVKKLNESLYSTIINYGNYRNSINNFPLSYCKYFPANNNSLKLDGNNLITNPDFELGDTLFSSDYDAFTEKGIGIFYNNNGWRAVVSNTIQTHGSWIGSGYKDKKKYLLLDGSTMLNAYAWEQRINITPNNCYQFRFYLSTLLTFKMHGAREINKWQLADIAVFVNGKCIGRCAAPDTVEYWQENTFYWCADTARTAYIQIKDLNTGNCYNDYAIDAISFIKINSSIENVKQDTGHWLSPIHTETIDSTAIIEIFANEIMFNKLPQNTVLSIADLRPTNSTIENNSKSQYKPNESLAFHERYHVSGKTLFTRYYYAYAGFAIRCEADNYNTYLYRRILPLLYNTLLVYVLLVLLILAFIRYTEKKQQMKALRYQLSNNITHELNTPVSTILAATDSLKYYHDTDNKHKLNEYIEIARVQAAKLSGLINNAMELVGEQKSDVILKKDNIMLLDLLTKIATQVKQSHDVSIYIQCPKEHSIYADPFHVNNVINTIVDNSIKYCKTYPNIIIDVTTSRKKTIISIKDNGIGVQKIYQRHIFKKHYRVPTEEVSEVGGYGLGLSYVALIMQLHKGNASVKSNGKDGTTIILTFTQ